MSVGGVHQEVSKQTHAINKSEVYSHYLGLLFHRILGVGGKDTTETGKAMVP